MNAGGRRRLPFRGCRGERWRAVIFHEGAVLTSFSSFEFRVRASQMISPARAIRRVAESRFRPGGLALQSGSPCHHCRMEQGVPLRESYMWVSTQPSISDDQPSEWW